MFDQIFSNPNEDQLYMIELFIHELKIFPDRVDEVTTPLKVSLKFANLPNFEISQEDFSAVRIQSQVTSSNKGKTILFDVGKSCLFSCNPNELERWIQEELFKLFVFKVKIKLNDEEEEAGKDKQEEENLICKTEFSLSFCQFNIVNKFQSKNSVKLSEPTSIRNIYKLLDPENKPFGSIRIFLRLSCCGKLIVTRFALQDKSFLFKTGHSLNEFHCFKIPIEENENENEDSKDECVECIKSKTNSFNSADILGLSLVCEDLARTDGGPLVNVPERFNTEDIENKDCIKENDDNLLQLKPCFSESDCTCSENNIDLDNSVRRNSCYENICNINNCDNIDDGLQNNETKVQRMRGGACGSADSCSCDYSIPRDNIRNNSSGVNCFQKCIEEAQEFLNSLGNKNGVAGLGIVGPSESPYFGRKRDTDYSSVSKDLYELESVKDTAYNDILYKNNKKLVEKSYDLRQMTRKETIETDSTKMDDSMRKQLYENHIYNENLTDVNPSDTDISTVFHKDEKYMKFPQRKRRRRKKKFRGKNKNFLVKNIKLYSSSASNNITCKPPIKISKHIMKHATNMREYNPGIYYGHRNCLDLNMRIPANMGWLWNTCKNPGISKPRYGWKPGAISRHVYYLLMKAKSHSGAMIAEKSASLTFPGQNQSKSPKSRSLHSLNQQNKQKAMDKTTKNKDKEEEEAPPLVQVHRKDGDYYVTINPVNQTQNIKPLQLKISRNEEDDNVSNSTAPDFHLACSAPGRTTSVPQSKVQTKDMDTQVKQQEILDSLKKIDEPKKPSQNSKPKQSVIRKTAKPKK